MNDKLTAIGKYNEDFNNYLPYNIKSSNIFQSSGLEKHIIKRHPDCLKYIGFIPQIIANPDYIGINPNEKVTSFELVKCISENVQIGIKLDAKDNYLYVATLHTITDSKVFQIFQIIHRLLFLYPKRTTLWLQQKNSRLETGAVRSTATQKKPCSRTAPSRKSGYITLITQEDIQKAINIEAQCHSPRTVRNSHGLISAVMRVYRPNFALNTALPKKVRPEIYIPSDAEIKQLLSSVAGTGMELPVLLAAFGPMRRGEICALSSEDISGNIVHVCKNMVINGDRE